MGGGRDLLSYSVLEERLAEEGGRHYSIGVTLSPHSLYRAHIKAITMVTRGRKKKKGMGHSWSVSGQAWTWSCLFFIVDLTLFLCLSLFNYTPRNMSLTNVLHIRGEFSSDSNLHSSIILQLDSKSALVFTIDTLPVSLWLRMEDSRDPIAQVTGSSRLWSRSRSSVRTDRVQAPGW